MTEPATRQSRREVTVMVIPADAGEPITLVTLEDSTRAIAAAVGAARVDDAAPGWVIAGYARTPPPPDPQTRRRRRRAWTQRFLDHDTAAGHVREPVRLDCGHDVDSFHDVLAYARRGR